MSTLSTGEHSQLTQVQPYDTTRPIGPAWCNHHDHDAHPADILYSHLYSEVAGTVSSMGYKWNDYPASVISTLLISYISHSERIK